MSVNFDVGDMLHPLKHTATALQLFRYSAVTWNPHRIHSTSPTREGSRRSRALAPAGARSPCCITEGLGPDWQVTKFAYRLRQPVYAPADLAYTARVTAADGDSLTLELIEENPSGELGFEGTAWVSRTAGATP